MNPNPKKILLVDDSPVILKALSLKLKAGGYEVLTAEEGAEAVRLTRQQRPALILLDINFPPNMSFGGAVDWDGFQVMDWLRRLDEVKGIPVIVITSGDSAKYKARALAGGAVNFFQKPIKPEELLAAIRQALGETEKPAPPAD